MADKFISFRLRVGIYFCTGIVAKPTFIMLLKRLFKTIFYDFSKGGTTLKKMR